MVAKSSVASYTLIIANSGRMLAELAQRAGYQVLVIDRFGDADTEAIAHTVYVVEQLTIACLQAVIEPLFRLYGIDQIVVGSGFEGQIESLAWLESQFLLAGNGSNTVSSVTEPVQFCQSLDNLQISYPETCFYPPNLALGPWLIKPYASEGGLNIKFYQSQIATQNYYWQRYLQGEVYSVLFVGNGAKAQLIAYNQQWSTPHRDGQDFVFSGVMQKPDISLWQHHKTISTWIKKLTEKYALVGLNGIDFIVSDEQCWLLEINARPPASMILYQRSRLFEVHINACRGFLPSACAHKTIQVSAYQIIYASAQLVIPVDFKWPIWAFDQSKASTFIDTQQVICSIIASANNTKSVLKLLQYRTLILYQLLNKKGAFSTCNIQPALINYPSL